MRIFLFLWCLPALFLALSTLTEAIGAEAEPATKEPTRPTRSVKTNTWGVRESNSILGGRAGQFGAFEGQLALGLNYEYMYTREFGFGAQVHRAAYGTEIAAGPMKVNVKSTAITVVALGNYHPAFLRASRLDAYLSVGLAHSFVSAKSALTTTGMDVPESALPAVEITGDSTFLVASLSARYFLDRHLSAVGSVGLGLSTLSIGMDYLF